METFIVKAFWRETWNYADGTVSSELLYDKVKSGIPIGKRLQWFWFMPFGVQKVKVEFKNRTSWRLKGMERGSKTSFSGDDVVGDVTYSAACAYGDRVRKMSFEVYNGTMNFYLEVMNNAVKGQKVNKTREEKSGGHSERVKQTTTYMQGNACTYVNSYYNSYANVLGC